MKSSHPESPRTPRLPLGAMQDPGKFRLTNVWNTVFRHPSIAPDAQDWSTLATSFCEGFDCDRRAVTSSPLLASRWWRAWSVAEVSGADGI